MSPNKINQNTNQMYDPFLYKLDTRSPELRKTFLRSSHGPKSRAYINEHKLTPPNKCNH